MITLLLSAAVLLAALWLGQHARQKLLKAQSDRWDAMVLKQMADAKQLAALQTLQEALDDRIAASAWYRDTLVLQRRAIVAEQEVRELRAALLDKLEREDEDTPVKRVWDKH